MPKPRIRLSLAPTPSPDGETRLERARRLYGRPFGVENWPAGQKARYWTAERVADLAAVNAALRQRRVKQ